MNILITNVQLNHRTGTEIVVRDLDAELRRRGHAVCVYTPNPGILADEIRAAGGTVIADLTDVPFTPDVIHGHHHVPTVEATVRFPGAGAIFVCHDRLQAQDIAPRAPSLRRYVAVDRNCGERLVHESGIEPGAIRLIHNAVDLDRFVQRPALPERPKRAAVFGNNAAVGGFLDAVRAACDDAGIELDAFGSGVGHSIDQPELVLGGYDLVFAKARCALEALASGCAVVVVDRDGLGDMVTEGTVAAMRDWNFGRRCLQRPVTRASVAAEIARYDPVDAAAVSAWIRQRAGLGAAVDAYLGCYLEAAADPAPALPERGSWVDAYGRLLGHAGGLEKLLRSVDEMQVMAPLPDSADGQLALRVTTAPTIVRPGASFALPVELRNGSAERLTSTGPYPLRFAYRWLDAVSGVVVAAEGQRTELTKTVRPGASHAQAVAVLAPSFAGRAVLRLTLVQEGLRWFDSGVAPVVAELPIEIRDADPLPWRLADIAALVEGAPGWFSVQRDGPIENLGFVSRPLPAMLTFAENAAFLRQAIACASTVGVIVPPELADSVPAHVGVVTSPAPRRAFVDAHHQLFERSTFYGASEPSDIALRARIHATAFVDPMNVRIEADAEIGPGAVILGPAVIGRGTRVEAGAVIGSTGFQTVDIDGKLTELRHAGGVAVGTACIVFANAVVARGLFRQQTRLGDGCRIGNGAFVSHNADIGERSFVGHGAVVNGNVDVGAQAWIGPGAVIANNLRIGRAARVSLGCTVMTGVADGAHVTGPAAVGHWTMLRAAGRLRTGKPRPG